MKFENIAYALMFALAMGAPVADAESDPAATFDSVLSSYNKGHAKDLFYLKGKCNSRPRDDIYVCPDGRLTYGKKVSGSIKFRGSIASGYLIGSSFNNGFQPVGCNGYNVGIGYQGWVNFQYYSYGGQKRIKGHNKYYCDQGGYIYKEKPSHCNTCEPIEFECDGDGSYPSPPPPSKPNPPKGKDKGKKKKCKNGWGSDSDSCSDSDSDSDGGKGWGSDKGKKKKGKKGKKQGHGSGSDSDSD